MEPPHLYKILPTTPGLPAAGLAPAAALPGTALDARDGFVHLSTRAQVRGVLQRFFQEGDDAVLLVKLSHAKLLAHAAAAEPAALRWEQAGAGVFAHLYGAELVGGVVEGWRVLRRAAGSWEAAVAQLETEGWFVD